MIGQKAKHLQSNETVWARSRKESRSSVRGGGFFLTSLFIELIDPLPHTFSGSSYLQFQFFTFLFLQMGFVRQ